MSTPQTPLVIIGRTVRDAEREWRRIATEQPERVAGGRPCKAMSDELAARTGLKGYRDAEILVLPGATHCVPRVRELVETGGASVEWVVPRLDEDVRVRGITGW